MKLLISMFGTILLTGCSVFGQSNVETAPYVLLKAEPSQQIEVRNYEAMVLVSAEMAGDGRNSAFRKLFRYISGDNLGGAAISMTAPVIMDGQAASSQGTEISMTAPVFMDNKSGKSLMSFVMPKEFTLETTPKPTDATLVVSEVKNYKVVAIQFSGTLSDSNVATHTKILQDWMNANDYIAIGAPLEAGYNGPMTLPMLRRNEILIEIK